MCEQRADVKSFLQQHSRTHSADEKRGAEIKIERRALQFSVSPNEQQTSERSPRSRDEFLSRAAAIGPKTHARTVE